MIVKWNSGMDPRILRAALGLVPPPRYGEIEAAKTPRGAWTKDQLAQWGVPWPPPKGWRTSLTLRALRHHNMVARRGQS